MDDDRQVDAARVKRAVERRVTEIVKAGLHTAAWANAFVAVLVAGLIGGTRPDPWLATWLVAILALNGLRVALGVVPPMSRWVGDRPKLFLDGAILVNVVLGCAWSALILYHPDLTTPDGSLVVMAAFGLAAGSIAINPIPAVIPMVFGVPIYLVTAVRLAAEHDPRAAVFAMAVTCFAVILMVRPIRGAERVEHLLRLEAERELLIGNLERMNRELAATADLLSHAVSHDTLTGVLNRTGLTAMLTARMAEPDGRDDGLVLIDLDDFKAINERYGHATGDEILRETARRLGAAVPLPHWIGRLGGDQFAVLLPGQTPEGSELGQTLGGLIGLFAEPIRHEGRSVSVNPSLGFALRTGAGDLADWLARADSALGSAKAEGRNRWIVYDDAIGARIRLARDLQNDMAEALERGDIELHWQPQLSLARGHVVSFEGLLRWTHPMHGRIAPPAAVAAARAARVAPRLVEFVVGRACDMLARLDAAGRPDMSVGINLSPHDLLDDHTCDVLEDITRERRVDRARIEIEIIEDAMLDDTVALGALGRIAAAGFRLAVDDFGAGYSWLSVVQTCRFATLKIDRRFVGHLETSIADRTMIRTAVAMARSLGLDVVAEGVETEAQLRLVSELDCDRAQGWFVGHPVDTDTAVTLAAEQSLTEWLTRLPKRPPALDLRRRA